MLCNVMPQRENLTIYHYNVKYTRQSPKCPKPLRIPQVPECLQPAAFLTSSGRSNTLLHPTSCRYITITIAQGPQCFASQLHSSRLPAGQILYYTVGKHMRLFWTKIKLNFSVLKLPLLFCSALGCTAWQYEHSTALYWVFDRRPDLQTRECLFLFPPNPRRYLLVGLTDLL